MNHRYSEAKPVNYLTDTEIQKYQSVVEKKEN